MGSMLAIRGKPAFQSIKPLQSGSTTVIARSAAKIVLGCLVLLFPVFLFLSNAPLDLAGNFLRSALGSQAPAANHFAGCLFCFSFYLPKCSLCSVLGAVFHKAESKWPSKASPEMGTTPAFDQVIFPA